MSPLEIARSFSGGRILGRDGRPLVAKRALLTRKSLLLFTPDQVLKLRRPRLIDGYDQEALSTRVGMTSRDRWYLRRMNRGVELGACELRFDESSGRFALVEPSADAEPSDDGEPVLWMRRLPDELRADTRLASGAPQETLHAALEHAMQRLARLHGEAEVHVHPPFGEPTRARARFEAALTRIADRLDPSDRDRLARQTGEWLDELADTLAHRVYERRVRTVHGELRAEHVFLPGPGLRDVVFIDPHDGHDAERALDTAEEVMSFALDLELLIGPERTARVIDVYAGETYDGTLRKVDRFYKRLACLRRVAEALDDGAEPGADQAEVAERVRFFVARALRA